MKNPNPVPLLAAVALAVVLWMAPAPAAAQNTTTEGVCGTSYPSEFLDSFLPRQAASIQDCRKICERQGELCMSVAAANGRCARKELAGRSSAFKTLCSSGSSAAISADPKQCRHDVQRNRLEEKDGILERQRDGQRGCREYKAFCIESCQLDDD